MLLLPLVWTLFKGIVKRTLRNILRWRRYPRIITPDCPCPLMYKKGENLTNAELVKEESQTVPLRIQEEFNENLCVQVQRRGLVTWHVTILASPVLVPLEGSEGLILDRASGTTTVNRLDEGHGRTWVQARGYLRLRRLMIGFFTFIVDCKYRVRCF
ncbi:hypothetical protein MLD38_038532 [Melastoma candidum]|uniref:Uncharacterized protein n=1 Tax=Melastoma candidum TaxID=119954 RepID=A0ACB9KZ78_9MYRT|nr:hypothetical protein MLD38_038532 [Melastoma candidum]